MKEGGNSPHHHLNYLMSAWQLQQLKKQGLCRSRKEFPPSVSPWVIDISQSFLNSWKRRKAPIINFFANQDKHMYSTTIISLKGIHDNKTGYSRIDLGWINILKISTDYRSNQLPAWPITNYFNYSWLSVISWSSR